MTSFPVIWCHVMKNWIKYIYKKIKLTLFWPSLLIQNKHIIFAELWKLDKVKQSLTNSKKLNKFKQSLTKSYIVSIYDFFYSSTRLNTKRSIPNCFDFRIFPLREKIPKKYVVFQSNTTRLASSAISFMQRLLNRDSACRFFSSCALILDPHVIELPRLQTLISWRLQE